MDVVHFSTTLIQGLELCPMRAIKNHLQRMKTGDDIFGSNPTRFGTIVHDVAEIVHGYDLKDEAPPKEPIDIFDDVWRKHHLRDFDYYQLGRDKLEEWIDRTLYDRNGVTIAVELPFVIDLESLEVWSIEGMTRAAVKKLCKKITKNNGVPVISKIDRVDQISDTEIEIHDYKTNFMAFTREEVDNSLQLGLYDIAIRAFYPEVEDVTCVFDMIRHGRFSTIFTDAGRETIRSYIVNLWYQAVEMEYPTPDLNKFCPYCPYKLDCTEYVGILDSDLSHPYSGGMTTEERWTEFDRMRSVEKLAKARKTELQKAIVAGIMDEDGRGDDVGMPLPMGDGDELYLQPNPRYEYPFEDVIHVLERHNALTILNKGNVCKISRPNLDREVKVHSKIKREIDPLLVKQFVSPTLKKRLRGVEKDASTED